jgi:hypothetical protein
LTKGGGFSFLNSRNIGNENANKALHRTGIPLRSIAAGELCRYALMINGDKNWLKN